MSVDAPTIWTLLDDRAGNRSQCLGVAEALGLRFETRELRYTASAALPNFVIGASFAGLRVDSRVDLVPPWPDVVIAAGRRTAPVARHIKGLAGGATFLAQIMDPGDAGWADFDLVAVPRHDRHRVRPNMIQITGAPHRLTPLALAAAAEEWRHRLGALPAPRIALMVGGSTRRRRFDKGMAGALGRMVDAMARQAGGSVLVSTSRRTGEAADALIEAIQVPRHVYRWGDGGDNPYAGYLGLADAVIVTGDSVSMCSEACAGTGPVYIHAPEALSVAKHGRLHRELFDAGLARPLEGRLESWSHPRLNAAADVAGEMRARLGL